jgi:SAM-dependent methyltransferase
LQHKGSAATAYKSGRYFRGRSDLVYYSYFELMVRCIAPDANSILDVGTGSVPYLEWFQWIEKKVSVDIKAPYSSQTVEGVVGNILDVQFSSKFDICTCMQVLEHIDDPIPFARRLLELSDRLLISVPYKWPKGANKHHPQDPVDEEKVLSWFGRKPNYSFVVSEPFINIKSKRMFSIYDRDPAKKFGSETYKARRRR